MSPPLHGELQDGKDRASLTSVSLAPGTVPSIVQLLNKNVLKEGDKEIRRKEIKCGGMASRTDLDLVLDTPSQCDVGQITLS